MSDVMLCGILRMPFDDGGDIHLMQLKQACHEAATELERRADAFTALQTAALKVVEETDRIHDNEPWPAKYRAPYGAITELRALLAKQLGAR